MGACGDAVVSLRQVLANSVVGKILYAGPSLVVALDAPEERLRLTEVSGYPALEELPIPGLPPGFILRTKVFVIERMPGPDRPGKLAWVETPDGLDAARALIGRIVVPRRVTGAPEGLTDVAFISGTTGIGVTEGRGRSIGAIYRTVDGGATWRLVHQISPGRFTQALVAGDRFVAIGLKGCSTATCPGIGMLVRSLDGGDTWDEIRPSGWPEHAAWPNDLFQFPSPDVGYAMQEPNRAGCCGLGGLWKTSDGGRTWRQLSVGEGGPSGGLHFIDEKKGFITPLRQTGEYSFSNEVRATTDGGQTWRTLYSTSEFPLRAVYFVDRRHGFAAGGTGGPGGVPQSPPEFVVATTDSGATWTTVYKNDEPRWKRITKLGFINPLSGWMAAGGCNSMAAQDLCGGFLNHTKDGGRAWRNTGRSIKRLRVLGNHAWIVDREGIHRTENAGVSWSIHRTGFVGGE